MAIGLAYPSNHPIIPANFVPVAGASRVYSVVWRMVESMWSEEGSLSYKRV
jgi:hypothetical protein